ncbi:MAG TPA: hypothetical protein VIV40_26230 [Kofleriaceae bacterium]
MRSVALSGEPPMLDVTTTITINGNEGDRFLASLATYRAPVPRALRWLADSEFRSIEVDLTDAELIAEFVSELIASGWIDVDGPPLLFSPRVGDQVRMRSDVLAEIARQAPGLPPTWRYVPAGTTGRLLGWRGEARAVVDIDDTDKRLVVFISLEHVTRARLPGIAFRRAG